MCIYSNSKAVLITDNEQLLELVREVSKRSKFYEALYANKPFLKFSDLPFINKKMLIEDQQKNPPFGSNVCVDRKEIVRMHRTSGTSSKPLLLVLTENDVENVVLAGKRAFITAGMDKEDIVFNCMNYCMWMGGFMDHMSIEKTGATAVPYGVGHTENLISMLLDIDSPSIHATPSYLNVIKKVLQEKFHKTPKELGLKKGFFGGEAGMDDESFRSKIEDEWGIAAINANYGMSEAVSIMGAECRERDGLHFTAGDLLYVELISTEGDSNEKVDIKSGAVGELVVTTLKKEAQPLIRYRTGDIIEIISTDACHCGEESFRYKVIGRRDDMLVVRGINFYPELLRPIISNFPQCSGNYTIKVPDTNPIDRIKIIIEVQENNNDNLEDLIQRDIRNKLFISPVIELVNEIKRTNNKLRMIERVKDV